MENKKIWVSMVEHKGMYYIVVKNKIKRHTDLALTVLLIWYVKWMDFIRDMRNRIIFTTFIFIPFASCNT